MQVLCPIVVGREAELSTLGDAVARAGEGHGGVVLIAGEAGIGKSRLARETSALAAAQGMRILSGRAVETTAPIPFRPLAEAIHSALRATGPPDDASLSAYRGVLRTFVAEWSGEVAPAEPSPFMLLEGIVRLLRGLAGNDGMLLVLEDLHWADGDTLSVLEYLADNLAAERALCIATVRSEEPSPALALADTLAARRTAKLLRPERLSAEDVARMADASLGANAPAPLVRVVSERTEGVPFLVEELLSAYVAAGGAEMGERQARATAVALPTSYRDLVNARLETLDDRGRTVVTAAALLGPSFEWSVIPSIIGLESEAVLAGLRSAVEAQLISASFEAGFRFRHALVPETIVAGMLPPERKDLSRRAAAAIETAFPGVPGDWCERAAGLREAAGDLGEAARHLQEAGVRALKRGALETAEEVLDHARGLVSSDPWHRMGIDRQLVDVLFQAGKTARMSEVATSLLSFTDAKVTLIEASAAVGMYLPIARAHVATGAPESARLYLDRCRTLAARIPDGAVHVEMLTLDAQISLATGDLDSAGSAAEEVLMRGQLLGMGEAVLEAQLVSAEVARRSGDTERAITAFERVAEDAAAAGRITWQMRALLALGSIELWSGSSSRLLDARDLASRTGAVFSHARAELLIGSGHLIRYELDEALATLERCVDECTRYRLPLLSDALLTTAIAYAQRGDEDSMERSISEAAVSGGHASPAAHTARAVLALVRENREGAKENFDRAIATIFGRHEHAFTPAFGALLHTLADREAKEQAGQVSHAHPRPDDAAVLRAAEAIRLGRDGRGAEAAGVFAAADASIEALVFNRHLARRLVAEAAVADGWGEPAAWLRSSVAFFEGSGLDRVASACKALLRRAGAPVPRRGRGSSVVPANLGARGITSREVDVLRLVGEGLSNREIAARLFVSPRTVETHVASLTRKLEVEGRPQLIAFAARSDPEGGT